MRIFRIALPLLAAALLVTGTAVADDVQTTDPDACAVFSARLMKSVLGRGVRARPERFPLPDRPAADPNLNHFLDVSHTSCTWANPASFLTSGVEAVNVQIYQRNDAYSGGGEPWSTNDRRAVYGRLAAGSAIDDTDMAWFARKYRLGALPRGMFLLLRDAKTGGQRRVWIGRELDDGLWLDVGIAATRRSALSIAAALVKRMATM